METPQTMKKKENITILNINGDFLGGFMTSVSSNLWITKMLLNNR